MQVRMFVAAAIAIGCSGSSGGSEAPVTDTGATDATVEASDDTGSELDTGSAVDSSLPPDVATDTSTDASEVAEDAALDAPDGEAGIAARCFADVTATGGTKGPEYDKFKPIVGSHCYGTNHQDIKGVEQVVFLGDSVTVCTPNTKHALSSDNGHCYRTILAEALAAKFSLPTGSALDWTLWKTYDYVNGVGGKMWAGAFGDCAKWGARTDDFVGGGDQLIKCFPTGASDKKTLFVFTMGGNDIAAITKQGADADDAEVAADYPKTRATAKKTIDDLEAALKWMLDPVRFPKGSYVVMANPYEFTDGTGDVSSCAAAGLAGFKDWKKPAVQQEIVVGILEAYTRLAVEQKVDVIWLLEKFCGHGFVSTKASSPPPGACWLGKGSELWFDETCIHPSDPGHAMVAKMLKAVVDE